MFLHSTPVRLSVIKTGANLQCLLQDIQILWQCNHVKPAKQKDVQNLMKFFSVPDDAQQFYSDIFKPISNNAEDNVDKDGAVIYNEDDY